MRFTYTVGRERPTRNPDRTRAFAPLGLPVGYAAIGNTRALAAGVLLVLMAADTPDVSGPFAVIVAPASGGGDQPREQLDGLRRLLRVERLKPRLAERAFAHGAAVAALGQRHIMNVWAFPRLVVLFGRG